MDLLAVVIFLGVYLMVLVEFQLVVGVVVVEFFLEPVVALSLRLAALSTLLFPHQQSIYL
jgi:hypothetical protein